MRFTLLFVPFLIVALARAQTNTTAESSSTILKAPPIKVAADELTEANSSKLRILVNVEGQTAGDPAALIIKSYVTRELRKASDVRLVDDYKDSIICIYVSSIGVYTQGGKKQGLVLNYNVCSTISNQLGSGTVRNQQTLDDKTKQFLLGCFDNSGCLIDSFMQTTYSSGLEEIIKEDVARIDGADLEPLREKISGFTKK